MDDVHLPADMNKKKRVPIWRCQVKVAPGLK